MFCLFQPCPESREFREDQCTAYDSIPYDGTLFHWAPHNDDDDPCALTCRGQPSNFEREGDTVMVVAKLADKVQDGTRCRLGSLDMCIDGKCQVNIYFKLYAILRNKNKYKTYAKFKMFYCKYVDFIEEYNNVNYAPLVHKLQLLI